MSDKPMTEEGVKMNTNITPPPLNGKDSYQSGVTNYASRVSKSPEKMYDKFGENYGPIDKEITVSSVVDCLLKTPARITYEVSEVKSPLIIGIMFCLLSLCLLVYGFIMGTFSGGGQMLMVPLKLLGGVFFSALLCLPSLYIFVSLSGGKQSFSQTVGILLQALAVMGVLLVGFSPITWLFAQATNTSIFMGILHLCCWVISLWLGLALMRKALSHLNRTDMAIVKAWSLLFLLVLLQMSTTLRPIIGEYDGAILHDKKFFLSHWSDCMDERVGSITSRKGGRGH